MKLISAESMIDLATITMRDHAEYIEGMSISSVQQESDVLVFRGDFYLNAQGLPTEQTHAAFRVYKHLSTLFSSQYHLADTE